VACCNTQPYADAMLAWIDVIMGQGADGVFIDFVELRQPCYGDVANANNTTPHTHLYTPTSPSPRLNPSDPADPFANWIALAEPTGSQILAEAQDAAGRQGARTGRTRSCCVRSARGSAGTGPTVRWSAMPTSRTSPGSGCSGSSSTWAG
jgi:hypothetical protein